MNLKTKIICIVLAAVILIGGGVAAIIVIATKKPNITTLSAPENLSVSASGTVVWDKVENAEYYRVFLNSDANGIKIEETKYKLTDLTADCRIKVKAYAGNVASDFSNEVTFRATTIKPSFNIALSVTVNGVETDSVKAGETVELNAKLLNAPDGTDGDVVWEIANGEDVVEKLNQTGDKLTLKSDISLSGNKLITVRARSKADNTVYVEKSFTINAKTVLTQAMLDKIASSNVLAFDGFIALDVYNVILGQKTGLVSSSSVTIRTAMKESSGENNWFAEYENASLGIKQSIYCKKYNDKACEVSINFKNEENYTPMKDDNGNDLGWAESGYYNNFKGLKVSDFVFDEQSWRWKYVGKDSSIVYKMIASANPYSFLIGDNGYFELILDDEEGEAEIIGICSVAADDYSIVSGKATVQSLFVSLDVGENVKVPTIAAYESVDDYKDAEKKQAYLHLREAIANMQALTSYKTSYTNTSAMLGQSVTSVTGYEATVTDDIVYYKKYSSSIADSYKFTDQDSYGYKTTSVDGLYNSFYYEKETNGDGYYYKPSRAYEGDFKKARPSFDFVAEIFAAYAYDEETGLTVFATEDILSNVATTFYYGVGNDIAIYGLFAQLGSVNGSTFPTRVVIKQVNGKYYITNAAFYYSILSYGLYGVVDIEYSDFNTAEIAPETVELIDKTAVRQIPSKWSDITVIEQLSGSKEEVNVRGDEYLKKFFSTESKNYDLKGLTVDEVPFFGIPLGDSYGFGMAQAYTTANGTKVKSLKLYYDVPLSLSFTIDESLNKVYDYLNASGFTADQNGEYRKNGSNLVIKVADEGLDFFIYLWTEENVYSGR